MMSSVFMGSCCQKVVIGLRLSCFRGDVVGFSVLLVLRVSRASVKLDYYCLLLMIIDL